MIATVANTAIANVAHVVGRFGINPKEAERFIKFIAVGIMGFGVDFGVFNALRLLAVRFINSEEFLSWALGGILAISLFAAITNNFIWNRFWTYPDSRTKPFKQQYVQFAAVNFTGFFIRAPLFFLTHNWFGRIVTQWSSFEPEMATTVGDNMAVAMAVFIVMFWNFFVNRYWTFNDVSS